MSLKSKLLKFILGEEHANEKSVLNKWKDEAQANLDELKNIAQNQAMIDILKDYKDVDNERAWANIEQAVSPTKMFDFARISKIAAVLVLLLGAIWSFSLFYQNRTDFETLVAYHGSQQSKIDYRDGSVIDLDKTSELKELAFREFNLSGRAYFSVAKDPDNKFVVHTVHGDVEVLGTEFNISSNNVETVVYVKSGKVRVEHEGKAHILNTDEHILLQNGKAVKSDHPMVAPDIWKYYTLKFENHSLHHVLETIAIYYNLKIDWNSNLHKDDACKINTIFHNTSIDAVLKEMEVLAQIKYELKDNKLIIHDYKC